MHHSDKAVVIVKVNNISLSYDKQNRSMRWNETEICTKLSNISTKKTQVFRHVMRKNINFYDIYSMNKSFSNH